jgi:hypothetical protein
MSSAACGKEPPANNVYEDGVTLTITNKPLNAKAHVITRCEGAVCMIDGNFAYGGDGNIPKEEVTRLIFEQKGKKVALDVSSMYDSGVNNANIKQYVEVTPWGKDSYRIVGYFGAGDSTYICQWLVLPGGAIRNHISDYESLVTLTTKVQKDHKIPSTTGPDNDK